MKLKIEGGQPPSQLSICVVPNSAPARYLGLRTTSRTSLEMLLRYREHQLCWSPRPCTFASSPKYPGRYWTVPGSSSSSGETE